MRERALYWMSEPGDVNKWKGKVSVKRLSPGWGIASPGSGADFCRCNRQMKSDGTTTLGGRLHCGMGMIYLSGRILEF